jgi:hypothetical protein
MAIRIINASGIIPGNVQTSSLPSGEAGPTLNGADLQHVQAAYDELVGPNPPGLLINIGGAGEMPPFMNVNINGEFHTEAEFSGYRSSDCIPNLFPRLDEEGPIALPDHSADRIFMRSTPLSPATAREIVRLIRRRGIIQLEAVDNEITRAEFHQVIELLGASGTVFRNDTEVRNGVDTRVMIIVVR